MHDHSVCTMPKKLKSSARKSRRNKKIGIIIGVVLLGLLSALGALYATGQFNRPLMQYDLVVNVEGSGTTNSTWTQVYNSGASVGVLATASPDWALDKWLLNGDSVSSTNPYAVTVLKNTNLTAVFKQLPSQDKVLLETSMGNITVQLQDDKPNTSGNFKNLVLEGKYDGTIFHRVIEGFMIQGGETSQPVPSIPDEIGSNNHNLNGTIAMANAGPNTATSGFFINVADNSNLNSAFDTSYTVFGEVIDGMDVVMAISRVPVDNPSSQSPKPLQDVTLIRATLLP
jgi:peptidylprolyl isomerase